jgi:hypothetical protein
MSMHNGLCHFINAVTKEERKEQLSLAIAADAPVVVAAAPPPAAAAAPAPAAAAAPAPVPAPKKRKRCDICSGLYAPGTYPAHILKGRHKEAIKKLYPANESAEHADEYDV